MKVIIQDSGSRKYLSSDQTWTDAAADARDFRADANARTALHIRKDSRLLVVHYYEDVDYCIAIKTAGHNA